MRCVSKPSLLHRVPFRNPNVLALFDMWKPLIKRLVPAMLSPRKALAMLSAWSKRGAGLLRCACFGNWELLVLRTLGGKMFVVAQRDYNN